jgi:hypothetical protein
MKYFSLVMASVAIHFLLGFGAGYFGELSQSRTKELIEILIPEDAKSLLQKQIVRETNLPNKKPKYDLKPRFFSDTTKSTDEEMRAQNSGMTQNRSAMNSRPGTQSQGQQRPKGDGEGKTGTSLQAGSQGGLPTPGTSTVGEELPKDIKVGSWTSLNTERYLFYTFFARIEERVRWHWERSVKEAAEYIPLPKLMGNEFVTELEVVLDNAGNFEKVILHRKSGIEGFDQAAVNAFRVGSPYLNPPKELVQADNKLHLKYQINVSYAPPARM